MLATIVAQKGSSPRSAGAHILITGEGKVYGTIGGGPVEYAAIQLAGTLLKQRRSLRKTYRLRTNDEEELGMLCGGDVDVFFQYIQRDDERIIPLLQEARARLERKSEDMWLFIDITAPENWTMAFYGSDFPLTGMELDPETLKAAATRKAQVVHAGGRRIYSEPVNTAGMVFIFGAGHVAQALEPVLSRVGFRCVVLDNRREFLKPQFFSSGAELVPVDYECIGETIATAPEDYLIVMTHNADLPVLRRLISRKRAYLGVIGSKTKIAAVKEQLRREGADEESLNAMNAPIGIKIRSETPEEIAISIAAELIMRRAECREARL